MAEKGFIRDMMDVKILVLFVLHRLNEPADVQTIYRLCYVDNRLNYFDVCEAVPQLAENGQLEERDGLYSITPEGEQNLETLEPMLAYTVRTGAEKSVRDYQLQKEKERQIRTEIRETAGDFSVFAEYTDPTGRVFRMELPAPDKRQARAVERILSRTADRIFRAVEEDVIIEMEE